MARRAKSGGVIAGGVIAGRVRLRRSSLLLGTALGATGALVFLAPAFAQLAPTARPSGGQVVAGSANIAQNPATTTVNQASQRTAIEWQSFDVGSQHTVQFVQPSNRAVALNRVIGPDPSQVAGKIIANGNIIITNPSGVFFHQGAQVNANSLVVSAPGITNQNFMAGKMLFDQPAKPGAVVSNAGTITVKETGLAALVAPGVVNSGTINARMGRVVLGGAEAATLDLYGDGLVSIDVTKQVRTVPRGPDGKPLTALVTNTGTVIADGGTVQITAQAADGVVQNLVRAGGTIQANTVGGQAGRVVIAGVGGSVRIEGSVAANGSATEQAGQIAVTASDTVTVANGARVSASGRNGGSIALGTTIARAQAGRAAALSHGASPGTPSGTARQVVVEQGAAVAADGQADGSGGTVAVLSTQRSQIDGHLSVRGGPSGGDGGVIEASSDGVLLLTAGLDAGASAGKGGTIYLDPFDLVIGTGSPEVAIGGSSTDPTVAAGDEPTTGTSYITPETLTALAQGGAVTISISASNDLTVAQPINLAQGNGGGSIGGGLGASDGGPSLYLHADHNLTVLANITLGTYDPSGNVPTLTLDAGHNVAIGPADGSYSVALRAYGNITMTATAAFSDTVSSSITIHDTSVIDSQAAIHLQAANRVDIGSSVSITGGPNGGFGYGDSPSYAGVVVEAGSDITVADNSTLAVRLTGDGAPGILTLDAGGNVIVGTGNHFDGGGSGGSVTLQGGDSYLTYSVPNAPVGISTGSVTLGSNSVVDNTPDIYITTGSDGAVTLAAGSALRANLSAGTYQGVSLNGGTGGMSLGGTVDGGPGGRINLRSVGGDVTESSTGALITSDLIGNAASFLLSSANNQIAYVGYNQGEGLIATAGDVTVASSVPLTIGRTDSTGGGISVPTGQNITLTADSLTIGSGNIWVSSGGEGGYYIYNALSAPGGSLTIQPLTSGRAMELASGGKTDGVLSITRSELDNVDADRLIFGSTVAGPITVGTAQAPLDLRPASTGGGGFLALDLISASTIKLAAGSSLSVATLTANGTDVQIASGSNQIDTLGASSATKGYFDLVDGTPLTLSGALSATQVIYLQLPSLSFGSDASVTADGLQLITSNSGQQTELVQGAQTQGRLSLNQAMIDKLSVRVLTLGGGYAPGDFIIGNAGDTVDLTGHASILSITGSSNVSEGAGASLRVGFFDISNLSNGAYEIGTVTMNGPNQIGDVFSETRGAFSLTNVGPLQLSVVQSGTSVTINNTGDISILRQLNPSDGSTNGIAAPSVSITATGGNIGFDAGAATVNTLYSTGTVTLTASGTITETVGTITAGTLTGSAASANLGNANLVGTLGSFTTTGDFTLANAQPLSVGGAVAVGNGHTLTLDSDSLTIGGSLSAPSGTVAIAPYTPGSPLSLAGFIPAGAITADTLQVGNATTGDITIGGTFSLTGITTLSLVSGGAVTESAGASLQVATLTGRAASANLGGQNQISTLGAFTTTGAFSLVDGAPVTLSGGISVGTGQTLTLQTYHLALGSGGSLAAPGGRIVLVQNGAGALGFGGSFPAGTITADVLQLGNATTTDISLGGLSVPGVGTLDLVASGAITQAAGTALVVSTLTGTAGNLDLAGANRITTLGAFTTTGGFTLADAQPLTLGGVVSVGGGQALTLLADSFSVGAGGGLQAPGGTVTIAPYTAGGTLTVGGSFPTGAITARTLQLGNANTGGITISGTLALGSVGTLDVVASGAVSETGGGAIQVATLTGSAGSASLGGANQITTLGAFGSTGDFTLANAQPLSVGGAVAVGNGHTLTLDSDSLTIGGGSLSAPGGTVAIAPYTAGHALSLAGFIPAGAITADTLQVGNATTGDISIGGTFSLTGINTLSLVSGGAVTESQGASLQVANLTGSAASADLGGANQIGTLGRFTTTGAFTLDNAQALSVGGSVSVGGGQTLTLLTDSLTIGGSGGLLAPGGTVAVAPYTAGQGFTLDGSFPAGAVVASTLQIGNGSTGPITLSGTLNLGSVGTLSLVSGGAISEAGGASVQVGTLTGSGASADLGGANRIGTLGAFTTTGAFTLADAQALSVGGQVSVGGGQTLTLLADSLTINGSGGLLAPGGTVAIAPYTSGSTLAISGSFPTGAITASTLQLGNANTGGITISGTLALGSVGRLDLVASGAVSEAGGGAIQVSTLTGSAGSADLGGANLVGTLAGFSTVGDFTLANAQPLSVGGAVAVGSLHTLTLDSDSLTIGEGGSLAAPGGTVAIAPYSAGHTLSLAGFIPAGAIAADTLQVGNATTGHISISGTFSLTGITTLSLVSGGAVTESQGASLQVANLTGSANSANLGGPNQIATLGSFTTPAGFTLHNVQTLTVIGPVSDPTTVLLSVSQGDLLFGGNVDAGTLNIQASGAAVQTGGVLTANLLTGSAEMVSLRQANQISTLGPFSVGGANQGSYAPDSFYLTDNRTLTLVGAVSARAGSVVLDTSANRGADIVIATAETTLGGDFVAYGGHDVSVTSAGSIAAANGSLFLEASYGANSAAADGAILLNGPIQANNIYLGAGPGGINIAADITAAAYLAMRGQGNGDPALIDLVRGPITQVGGVITTTDLSARGMSVALERGNAIQTLGHAAQGADAGTNVATAGDFRVASTLALSVSRPVSVASGQTIALSSDALQIGEGGSLSAPGGTVAIAPYTAGHALSLAGFVPAGAITADTLQVGNATTGDISISGSFALTNVGTLALVSGGAVGESAGAALQVGTLTVQADSASLGGSNAIGTLGTVATTNGFSLTDTQSLTIAGPVGDGTSVALSVGGDLSIAGSVQAGSMALSASGPIQLTGTIGVTGALSLTAAGTVTQTGGTLSAGSLSGGAVTSAQFGVAGTAAIGTLGDFTVLSPGPGQFVPVDASVNASGGAASLTLANAAPLTVAGSLTAQSVTLSAPGTLTLAGGQITAGTINLTVGAGANAANLVQTGTTNFTGSGTATLALPASGGTISLAGLSAPGMAIVLDLGSGSATGNLSGASLQVLGSGGSATLLGSVNDVSGAPAAAIATISPQQNTAYTLNGCIIASAACATTSASQPGAPTVVPVPPPTPIVIVEPPTPTPTPPPIFIVEPPVPTPPVTQGIAINGFATAQLGTVLETPKGFLGSTLGNILKPDLFIVDLVTIGIVRSPTDPELLLPNVSDRDY